MSVRGEQFWLDKTRPNQIRPRARPRYTLTPSLVFKGDTPMMALGTPGGDNQDQTILQAFLSIVEFWDDWYPNLHAAFERPRVQTLHFYGSFWPHTAGFNKLNVEATVPDAVYNELRARGHDVSRLRTFGMSGCATAVMIDPASGNRFAGGDPRRDCYAMAYDSRTRIWRPISMIRPRIGTKSLRTCNRSFTIASSIRRWPACPDHMQHPLWLRNGHWCCENSGKVIARLGELGSPSPGRT